MARKNATDEQLLASAKKKRDDARVWAKQNADKRREYYLKFRAQIYMDKPLILSNIIITNNNKIKNLSERVAEFETFIARYKQDISALKQQNKKLQAEYEKRMAGDFSKQEPGKKVS